MYTVDDARLYWDAVTELIDEKVELDRLDVGEELTPAKIAERMNQLAGGYLVLPAVELDHVTYPGAYVSSIYPVQWLMALRTEPEPAQPVTWSDLGEPLEPFDTSYAALFPGGGPLGDHTPGPIVSEHFTITYDFDGYAWAE